MTKKKVQNLLKHLVCILLCLTVILPFYMVVINSFKSKGEASRMSLALPKEWLFAGPGRFWLGLDMAIFTWVV